MREGKDRADSIKLIQKGGKIIIKEDVPNNEMTPKDVLNTIGGITGELDKAKNQLKQMEAQIPTLKEQISVQEKMLKKFSKFKDWATNVQESRARAIAEEIGADCVKEIQESYKHDPTMTDEQNKAQMYRQWLNKMATHEKIATEISSKIMQKMFFVEPAFKNPWN